MRHYILFCFFAAFFLMSCGSQKEVIKKYYVIEAPDDSTKVTPLSTIPLEAWCEVKDVEVYPTFNTRRIVLRDESHQVRYFGNHEWAVSPADFLTPIIIDFLAEKRVFSRVAARFWERIPDYRVQTTIYNLEVNSSNKTFEAHLDLKFDLIDVKTDAIVLTHSADRKSVLEKRNLNLLASEISNIFHEELEVFSVQLKKTLPK
jgi:uncharacterized lipoprotein YmbA